MVPAVCDTPDDFPKLPFVSFWRIALMRHKVPLPTCSHLPARAARSQVLACSEGSKRLPHLGTAQPHELVVTVALVGGEGWSLGILLFLGEVPRDDRPLAMPHLSLGGSEPHTLLSDSPGMFEHRVDRSYQQGRRRIMAASWVVRLLRFSVPKILHKIT